MKKYILLIFGFCAIVTSQAQVSKSINISTSGTLAGQLTIYETTQVTNLSITGNIDARDFAFMRDKMTNLAVLNISNTAIKAYTGTLGTYADISFTYPANEVPIYAFYNPILLSYKPSLTSIILPQQTTSIGYLAFYYCWNLTSIEIPATVQTIADYSFYGCFALNAINVANGNNNYSSVGGVLFNKAGDTLLVCPNAKIANYTIPSGVKHIANSAFENCYGLSSIKLPNSLLSVGNYAFANCSGIYENLIIPDKVKQLGDGAFYGCYNLFGTITIPASLTDLGVFCFMECNYLNSFVVNAANPVYASANDVLYSKNLDTLFICPSAKTGIFNIPASVRLIGSYAFYNCYNLVGNMTIPQYVDYIGYYAFYGCTGISNYDVHVSNAYFKADKGVLYSKSKERLLSCPASTTGNLNLPVNLQEIDPGAFSNCIHISGTVNLPASLNYIGEYAFYNCPGIEAFSVNPNNEYFSDEQGLVLDKNKQHVYFCPLAKSGSYSLPKSIKTIGYSAFSHCSNLTEINLPTSLEEIGAAAFEFCTGLYDLHLPQNVNFIGTGAFYACTNLEQLSTAQPTPLVVDYYTFELIDKDKCNLSVPVGTQSNYRESPYWGEFANIQEVNFNTSMNKTVDKTFHYTISDGVLSVFDLDGNSLIALYNMHGSLVYSSFAQTNNLSIQLPERAVYILKINQFVEKILY